MVEVFWSIPKISKYDHAHFKFAPITPAFNKTSFDINDNSCSIISPFVIDGNTLVKHKACPHWFFMIRFDSTHVLPLTMIFHHVLLDFLPFWHQWKRLQGFPYKYGYSFSLAQVGATVHYFLILLLVVTIVLALPLPSIIFTCFSLWLMPTSLVINLHLFLWHIPLSLSLGSFGNLISSPYIHASFVNDIYHCYYSGTCLVLGMVFKLVFLKVGSKSSNVPLRWVNACLQSWITQPLHTGYHNDSLSQTYYNMWQPSK